MHRIRPRTPARSFPTAPQRARCGCSERFGRLGEDLPEVVGETSFADQYLGVGIAGGRFRGSPDKLRDVAGTWSRAGTIMARLLVDAHFTAFVGFSPRPALAQQDEPLVADVVAPLTSSRRWTFFLFYPPRDQPDGWGLDLGAFRESLLAGFRRTSPPPSAGRPLPARVTVFQGRGELRPRGSVRRIRGRRDAVAADGFWARADDDVEFDGPASVEGRDCAEVAAARDAAGREAAQRESGSS